MKGMKPMLAQPAKVPIAELAGTHVFDLKLDGLRAMISWDGITAEIRNRSGVDITAQFPEVDASCQRLTVPCVLDGEIVALSGSFQDVAHRGKITRPNDVVLWMREKPCLFVAFDVLRTESVDWCPHPLLERRERLLSLAENAGMSITPMSTDPAFFEEVKAQGMEGVIAKRKTSTYRSGRWGDWTKYKAVRSLTCVAVGYEKGTGSREHFGAMFVALVGPQGPVEIGRVGTGFTAHEINVLKAALDAGVPQVVEVECLNVSKDGRLRFPVYKGLRTDLSVSDATLDQLSAIPRM